MRKGDELTQIFDNGKGWTAPVKYVLVIDSTQKCIRLPYVTRIFREITIHDRQKIGFITIMNEHIEWTHALLPDQPLSNYGPD